MADFYLGQGDTASPIFETLEDETGAAVDIQGATIKITATPIHGGTPIISNKTANNLQVGDGSDGSRGHVSYGEGANPYGAGETATSGDYLYTWTVTFASGVAQTFPNAGYRLLTITPDPPASAQEYVSIEELKKTLSLTGQTYADQDVKTAVQSATEAVNNYCERVFTMGSSETRTYYPISPDYAVIDDLVTSSPTVVSGSTTLVLGTDYRLESVQLWKGGAPYGRVRNLSIPGIYGTFGYGFLGQYPLSVTGVFGWPAVPSSVKQATTILASRYLQRARSSPFAILTFGDGGEAARLTRSDPDVASLLDPLKRVVRE